MKNITAARRIDCIEPGRIDWLKIGFDILFAIPAVYFLVLPILHDLSKWWRLFIFGAIFAAAIPLHEGLHLYAAHLLRIPTKQISGRFKAVHIGVVRKPTWVKFTLTPLWLPIFILFTALPFDLPSAVGLGLAVTSASSKDLACLARALRLPERFVSDTEEGIFALGQCPDA